ncbi:hypothetical protein RIF29_39140 [Crotalaria pallida]|uniref:Uncharacterized protein n=1 Tax=Crotalaria pallida TaxID=3830 RepID=A0AAN9HM75_CROPI
MKTLGSNVDGYYPSRLLPNGLASLPRLSLTASKIEGLVMHGHLTMCLKGKKTTGVRLATIVVGTCGRGELGKLFTSMVKPLIVAVVPPSSAAGEDNLSWAMENTGEFTIASTAKLCQESSISSVAIS